jgi:isopenicillin N synthase-like dioxygenase
MSIPTIDISPYLDGTDKKNVATQINKACEEIGFFMIKGHGVSLDVLQKVQTASNKFFDLPLSTKLETQAPFGLGYMGVGKEHHAATLEEGSQVKDYKESLNLALPIRDKVWPTDEELREVCGSYYGAVSNLAAKLMRLFALALEQEETFFDDKIDNAFTVLRLLNYPEYEVKDKNMNNKDAKVETRNGEHTDYGTLTILWSSDSRGLQARSRNGEWIDVISPPEQFIINIGDLMMHWTNDRWV